MSMMEIYCGKMGKLNVRIMFDAEGFPLGVARVVMKSEQRAQQVVDALNGQLLRGCTMRTYFAVPMAGEIKRDTRKSNVARLLGQKRDPVLLAQMKDIKISTVKAVKPQRKKLGKPKRRIAGKMKQIFKRKMNQKKKSVQTKGTAKGKSEFYIRR